MLKASAFDAQLLERGDGEIVVIRVQVVYPEVGLIEPLFQRVVEDAGRPVADEREGEGISGRFPDDCIGETAQQVAVTLLGLIRCRDLVCAAVATSVG
jgi:hypothetical protein